MKNGQTRLALTDADFSLPAARVVRSLDQFIEWRGKPQAIRCDTSREYVSQKLIEWARRKGIALRYIQPGKPKQNAYVERYNRTFRISSNRTWRLMISQNVDWE